MNIHTTLAIYSITDAPKSPRTTNVLPAALCEHRELLLLTPSPSREHPDFPRASTGAEGEMDGHKQPHQS